MSNDTQPFNQSHPTGTLLHSVLALKLHNPATGTMHANRKGKIKRTPNATLSSSSPHSNYTPLHSTTDDLYLIAFHSSPAHCKPFQHNDLHPTWSQIIASHPLNTLLTPPPPACLPGLTLTGLMLPLSPVYVIIVTLSSGASTQGSQEWSQGRSKRCNARP